MSSKRTLGFRTEMKSSQSNPLVPKKDDEDKAQYIWRSLTTQNRPISVYKGLIDMLGSVKSAVLFSQMIYWTRSGINIEQNHGWFFKTTEDFSFETGLSRKEQLTAKKQLKDLNLLEFKVAGIPAAPFYRINLNGLSNLLFQTFDINTESSRLTLNDIRNRQGNFEEFLSYRLPYHTILANIGGGVNAGLMLSMMLQNLFKGNSQKVQGFITKSIEQWHEQTGLSYKEQFKAREYLKQRGLISERHLFLSRDIFIEINFKQCFAAFTELMKQRETYLVNKKEPKKGFSDTKKGFSCRTERLNTVVPKGEILSSPKVEYSRTETLNTVVPKGEIVYKEKITKVNTTDKEYLKIPQQQKHSSDEQVNSKEARAFENVVVVNELTDKKPATVSHITDSDLVWPMCFSDHDDRNIANLKFNALERKTQLQVFLDEMSGFEQSGKTIKQPIRYFEKLLELDRSGQFIPEVAHKVRKKRECIKNKVVAVAEPIVERQVSSRETAKQYLDALLKKRNQKVNLSV